MDETSPSMRALSNEADPRQRQTWLAAYTGNSYTLADNIENAIVDSPAAINLVGNGLNNTLTGNAANNLLTVVPVRTV